MSNSFGVGTDDALKAVMGGGNVFVTGPGGCVDSETEFLSPRGWVKIKDYKGQDVLVVGRKMNASFEQPTQYHDLPCDKMISFQGQNMNMVLSGEADLTHKKNKKPSVPKHLRQLSNNLTV